MKLAFIAYLHGYGGAEKQIIMLANEMCNRGHEVYLFSLCANNPCYSIDDKVKYVFLPDKGNGLVKIINRYSILKKQLKKEQPDIVISFWLQSAIFTAFMKKSRIGRVIYSERSDPGDESYNGLLGRIRKISLPRIDGFVFQSRGAQEYFDTRVQERSVVIHNPVLIKRQLFPEATCRRKVIVNIGRLEVQKNQTLLIKAFAKIAEDFPEHIIEIYGQGELKEELEKQVVELKLQHKVLFMGTCSNVHDKIYDAELFVLSSDYEGLPNALMEAMALGIPCVSTDCKPGGARALIVSGENGYLIPRGSVDKLAERMKYVLQNRDEAEEVAKRARNIRNTHSPKVIYDAWENYIKQIGEQM